MGTGMIGLLFHLHQDFVNVPHMIVEVDIDKVKCFFDVQPTGIRMFIDHVVFFSSNQLYLN